MPSSYHIPARFHASHSLLGRGIRRYVDDPVRAENLFVVAVVLLGTGLVLVHFLLTTIVDPGARNLTDRFWAVQIGLLLSYLGTCVVGVQRKITVTSTENAFEIQQGDEKQVIPYDSIQEAESISDTTYYGHYRKYERTQTFVNRLPPTVLLLHTDDGPVALGLSESDRTDLLRTLRAPLDRSPILSPTT